MLQKREFYKNIIKKLYIKWKPLFEESINDAKQSTKKIVEDKVEDKVEEFFGK